MGKMSAGLFKIFKDHRKLHKSQGLKQTMESPSNINGDKNFANQVCVCARVYSSSISPASLLIDEFKFAYILSVLGICSFFEVI
ncbi:hypothetical protein Ccrd_022108 [Cynara cardunculus var. scolymus]|uniref:Uncharacterized protein n=1 Tax=Cynara cardunculus var. scolymus TaxID=59895 RepID=A0A103XZ94_CYNCS|nr:hypothetical protein Ccrd_022108 [Cynara cardunculus var. scolymus]